MDIQAFVTFVRGLYDAAPGTFVPLHAPTFAGNEKKYVVDCIDTTYVSSVGAYVTRFEEMLAAFTGANHVVAIGNGTMALHLALKLSGVEPGELVVTQPLTFVATANAIAYCGAEPAFVDVDRDTMGLSPVALRAFLTRECKTEKGRCTHTASGRRVAAIVPMHTFGLPARIDEISALCTEFGIPLVEDAAESLGSFVGKKHTGLSGCIGTLSFNGNKTITTGGGGALLIGDPALAKRAKHLSTTAKVPHKWEFFHDEVAYNYRLPNLNAALGCAQMERLPEMLASKRVISETYQQFFAAQKISFVAERSGTTSNYWLNAIALSSRAERDAFLAATNEAGVMTRPIWTLMTKLPMFAHCVRAATPNAEWLEDRVVNIPSSPREG